MSKVSGLLVHFLLKDWVNRSSQPPVNWLIQIIRIRGRSHWLNLHSPLSPRQLKLFSSKPISQTNFQPDSCDTGISTGNFQIEQTFWQDEISQRNFSVGNGSQLLQGGASQWDPCCRLGQDTFRWRRWKKMLLLVVSVSVIRILPCI